MRTISLYTLICVACYGCHLGSGGLFKQKEGASSTYETFTSENDDESAEASILYPPGLLPDGVSLKIELGDEVATGAFASALAIGGSYEAVGPSISIGASASVDDAIVDQLQISIPYTEPASLALASARERIVVAYHIYLKDGSFRYGYIIAKNIAFTDGKLKFRAVGLGNYQALLLEEAPVVEVSQRTTEEVLSKSEVVEKEKEVAIEEEVAEKETDEGEGNTNHAPVLAAIGNLSHTWTNALSVQLSATDADSDTLTYSCSANCPSGLSVSSSGLVTWTTTSTNIGSYSSVTFVVSDGTNSDQETITLSVVAPSVVSSNLLVHLSAAQSFTASGCSPSTFSNLGSASVTATLTGFSGCASDEGWVGSGTDASPYALAFKAADSNYVTLGYPTDLDAAFSAVTLSAWVKPAASSVTSRGIFGKGFNSSGSFGGAYFLYMDANAKFVLQLATLNSSNFASSALVSENTWQYLSATYSAGTLKYYLNGILDSSYTLGSSGPTAGDSNPFKLSLTASNAVNQFNGQMSVVQFYNRALSAAEILQNCQANVHLFSGVSCQ